VKHILVPLSGSPLTETVLPHAVAIAQVFHAQITILHVLEQPTAALGLSKADPLDWYLQKSEAFSYLDAVKTRLAAQSMAVQTVLLEGRASEQIVEFAHTNAVDLLILSAYREPDIGVSVLSSTVQKILHCVRISALLVRTNVPITLDHENFRYQRLLVPLDGSPRAGSVLPLALALTQAHQAELWLVHVVSQPEMARHVPLTQEDADLVNRFMERNQAEGSKYLEQIQGRLAASAQSHLLVSNHVSLTLQTFSEQAQIDLLILSAHGYSGETRWSYGSVTNRFIMHGTTSLLIVQDLPLETAAGGETNVETRQPSR
jgi:nucleotide-binding universal stress UspA family protein